MIATLLLVIIGLIIYIAWLKIEVEALKGYIKRAHQNTMDAQDNAKNALEVIGKYKKIIAKIQRGEETTLLTDPEQHVN